MYKFICALFVLATLQVHATTDIPGSKIYFGVYEVQAGRLKSADGVLPRAGQQITLALDIDGLSTTVACGPGEDHCAALEPRLFVRFSGSQSFQEITGLPRGIISGRGPMTRFDYPGWESNQALPVSLNIPAGADRVEVYMTYNRYRYDVANCYMAYDMTECDVNNQRLEGPRYISNFGKNFQIPIQN